jgi:GTP diphosphokinase / guanosine-3',5'-bis(diphosphate) 3'-diphosphatase
MNKKSIQLDITVFDSTEQATIERALAYATKAHMGQFRKSGEPYITHPVSVVKNLLQMGMDSPSVVAGLLHDTVEDTGVSLEDITEHFGAEVAALVDGVTKVGEVDRMPLDSTTARAQASAENIRKLLLAMARDTRVIIIKMADRLHNLSTLEYLSPEKQQRIARESLEIYAPLADRLGMGHLKTQLEDLSFKFLNPAEYDRLSGLMRVYGRSSGRYLNRLKQAVRERLEAAGMRNLDIEGRQKHLYSIYRKLKKTDGDFDKLYDLIAIRVIVPTEQDCYQVLGILHQEFKPLIYRIKDYIAVPKPNGYRSLHTTVFALDGRITEFQIRTPQMHEESEHGLAAHFHYNAIKTTEQYAKRGTVAAVPQKLRWVQDLARIGEQSTSGSEFVETLQADLFGDRIFVFSPKGDLYELPEGSTAIDFAFAIHSDLGLRLQGAIVNGRIAPLDAPLSNRDVVEVLTRKKAAPNRDWVDIAKTNAARSRIRSWFRDQGRAANIIRGHAMLVEELERQGRGRIEDIPHEQMASVVTALHYRDADALYAALGEGAVQLATVVRRLVLPESLRNPGSQQYAEGAPDGSATVGSGKKAGSSGSKVVFRGALDMAHSLGLCCDPTYPDPLVGYITRGSGVTVHRRGCGNIPEDTARLIGCRWEGEADGLGMYRVQIVANNRIGLLRDLTAVIAEEQINIVGISSEDSTDHTQALVEVRVELAETDELGRLLSRLQRMAEVVSAKGQGV